MNAARLLHQTAYVAERTGVSATGDPTFGAATAIKCRYETGRLVSRGADGNTPFYADVLATDVAVSLDARVWPPGADPTKPAEALRPRRVVTAETPAAYPLYEVYV